MARLPTISDGEVDEKCCLSKIWGCKRMGSEGEEKPLRAGCTVSLIQALLLLGASPVVLNRTD